MSPLENLSTFSGRDELVNRIAQKVIYKPEASTLKMENLDIKLF